MHEHDVRYTLASPRTKPAAIRVRVRRVQVVLVVVLLFLGAGAVSVSALVMESHWWGVGAVPTGTSNGAWQITWVDRGLARDNQVSVGTLILTADGAPPSSESEINQATTLRLLPPSQAPLQVLRWAPSQLDQLLSISWIVVGAISLLLGVLVYLHATERALAVRFLGLWVGIGLAEVLEPATAFGNLVAEHAADLLTAGLAVGLLVDFLWRLLLTRRWGVRWLPDLLLLPGMGINILYLYAIQTRQPDALETSLRGYNGLLAFGVLLALGLILWVSLRRQASVARERARTLVGGMLLGLLPPVVLTALPILLSEKPLLLGQISSLSLIALPLAFAFAILRRDLLRVDSLMRNTALFLLTVIGMSIVAALLAAGLAQLPPSPALVLGIIAGAVLAPFVLAGARWITEAWLFPQVRRYRRLVAQGENIERTGLDPQRVAGQLIGEVHLALPVRQVAVFASDPHTGRLVAVAVPPAPTKPDEQGSAAPTPKGVVALASSLPHATSEHDALFIDETLSARLSREGGPLLVEPDPTTLWAPGPNGGGQQHGALASANTGPIQTEQAPPDLDSWHLLLPMRVRGRLVGILALSRREDEQAYSDTDLRLLRFLAGRRALALDYALLYADLHTAYERRLELDRLKDEFIVTAHHELRTPLTGVQGYLEMLRDLGPAGRMLRPDEVTLFIDRACHATDELTEQLNSLLSAAETRMLPDHLKRQTVQVSLVVQRAMSALDGLARQGKHRVQNKIAQDLIALADEEALYRVFLNLLSNALKYSSEGRPVLFDGRICLISASQLSSATTLTGGNSTSNGLVLVVELLIRDWGHGIEPRDQQKIFERFTRLERDLNSPVRGSGLGLAICKELVEGMGGAIWVVSEGARTGSTFFVRLPVPFEVAMNPRPLDAWEES